MIGNVPPEPDPLPSHPIPPGTGAWVFFRGQPQEQWLWDHPEDVPPPPPPPEGRFILHRFNGDEVYRFKSAVIWAYETERGVTLWFEVKADRQNARAVQGHGQDGHVAQRRGRDRPARP